MALLPARPDLDQLRRQAKELLRSADSGDPVALQRIHAVSEQPGLAAAQLVVARDHGFASWARLKTEVTRRAILDDRDPHRLAALLADDPALAVQDLQNWCDHPRGAAPLSYVAMLRFDTSRLEWGEVTRTAAMARALLAAGAPVNGQPGDRETPLITAASYGDVEVARVLIEAGADLERTAAPDAGGVPGGSALLHAAVYGMTAVLDLLVASGADVPGPVLGAAAGDLSRWPLDAVPATERLLALIMAADHERLDVIDQLVAAGTPVDAVDPTWGRHPLRLAAGNGRPGAVRRLVEHGADPNLTDDRGRTPLALSRAAQRTYPTHPGHAEVQAILEPVTGAG